MTQNAAWQDHLNQLWKRLGLPRPTTDADWFVTIDGQEVQFMPTPDGVGIIMQASLFAIQEDTPSSNRKLEQMLRRNYSYLLGDAACLRFIHQASQGRRLALESTCLLNGLNEKEFDRQIGSLVDRANAYRREFGDAPQSSRGASAVKKKGSSDDDNFAMPMIFRP